MRPVSHGHPLHVSASRIAQLGDDELNALMLALLRAHCYRCGANLSEVRVNTEDKAKDDGCDGWTPPPSHPDNWWGSVAACWQFKAGVAGQPSQLKGEITKRIPCETLKQGGHFIVVASGSVNGKKGEDDRLKVLVDEAKAAGLPLDKIRVITSESLAIWCNLHPAVSARIGNRPAGLTLLDEWEKSVLHPSAWHTSAQLEKKLADARTTLEFHTATAQHIHVQGPPGVGKSRFALELCRSAQWRESVVYFGQSADSRINELIDSVIADEGAQLTVVADEIQSQQLLPLRESVGRGNGRVHLITIGHAKTPDPSQIPAISIAPLERESMTNVVKGMHPSMPKEHVDFVVRFADGYVKLARLAAEAVMKNPTVSVQRLLDEAHIRGFLDGMLGPGNRVSLYVVAVLSSVGWTEDRQDEGKAIAAHLGLQWSTVCVEVQEFDSRLGIAPRGGRLRYISPAPLAVHLAVEAWKTFPDQIKSLPSVLPTEDSRQAYYDRLEAIASNPYANKFAREELSRFLSLDDYLDMRAARRWSVLAAANPSGAARNLVLALRKSSVDDRLKLSDRSRRSVVSALVRMAWHSDVFSDAAIALALLAEAENESWANNATGEFVGMFDLWLGGTAVPYLKRLGVLDQLMELQRQPVARLVIQALARIAKTFHSRAEHDPISDRPIEPEWQPSNREEHEACVLAALSKLGDMMSEPSATKDALLDGASAVAMMLRERSLRSAVTRVYTEARVRYPELREPLRRVIWDVLANEKDLWKHLSPEDVREIEELHSRFEDSGLVSRIHQFVGVREWRTEEQADLRPLAAEVVANSDVLIAEWPWLTSGEAEEGWRFGQALAEADDTFKLEGYFSDPELGRPDYRFVAGYLCRKRELVGDQWFEAWFGKQLNNGKQSIPILCEMTWRCGATHATGRMLARAMSDYGVDERSGNALGFGRWQEGLTPEILAEIVGSLTHAGCYAAALGIVEHRLKASPAELGVWRKVALQLVLQPSLVRSDNSMTSYYWKQLALMLLPENAVLIAEAIFSSHCDRTGETWFIEFSEARHVLTECVKAEPDGVWNRLATYLEAPKKRGFFAIGFPKQLIASLPAPAIIDWIAKDPASRIHNVGRITDLDLSNDTTLAARLLGTYGDEELVSSTFFSSFVSGSWTGPASDHWDQLANSLLAVAERTALPKLQHWARKSAESLQSMATQDRAREDEEQVRGR